MADKKNLLLLFDRPQEPVFVEKGPKSSVFDVPSNFLPDRYRDIGEEIQNRFSERATEKIPVKNDISLPDLSLPLTLGRHEQFSLFIPRHRKLAAQVIDVFTSKVNLNERKINIFRFVYFFIFTEAKTIDELQAVAVYSRDRLNPFLFNYALSVAILHRDDTKDLQLPLFVETFPEKFVDAKVFSKIREESFLIPDGLRKPIEIPKSYTASDEEIENRLWYFREDIGINLHHWHWHLVYPFESFTPLIVFKHRRGELFYYMHEQVFNQFHFIYAFISLFSCFLSFPIE